MSRQKWNETNLRKLVEDRNDIFLGYEERIIKGRKRFYIKYKCKNGHTVENELYNYKNKKGYCSECNGTKRKSLKELEFKLKEMNYKLIKIYSDIFNTRTRISVECDNGHTYDTSVGCILWGYKCRECQNCRKFTYDEVKEYISNQGDTLLSNEYISNYKSILIRCSEGHIYSIRYNKYKNSNQRCPYCNMSSGEQKIKKILEKYGIYFEIQYKFKDCKNKNSLPFDFIVYIDNTFLLIEYDGSQHYKMSFNDTLDSFVRRKINDGIKNEYCYFNNIPLIRIPYWEFDNIEDILIKELNLNKL